MRQTPGSRRSRGRGGRKQVPGRFQTFDSNGPSGRVRGNAQQVYEKYLALARDASGSGDRIMAENLFQHAEHYFRIMVANGGEGAQRPRANGEDNAPDSETSTEHRAAESREQPDVEVRAEADPAPVEAKSEAENMPEEEPARKPRRPRRRPKADAENDSSGDGGDDEQSAA